MKRSDTSIFKGFNISYPTYSVILPQTGYPVDVRSLNVSEVNKLKTSAATPTKATDAVNRCIYESIESAPPFITDYESFKKNITVRDRDALLYGLYHATFGDETDFNVQCRQCSNRQDLKVNISQMFSMNAYPGSDGVINSYKLSRADGVDPDPEMEAVIAASNASQSSKGLVGMTLSDETPADIPVSNIPVSAAPVPIGNSVKTIENKENYNVPVGDILTKTILFKLPVSNIVTVLRQPTLKDEEDMMGRVPFSQRSQLDLIYETLIIKRFEQQDEQGNQIVSVTDREDIILAYRSLPPRDQLKLIEKFKDEFGQYGIDLKATWTCTNCGSENDLSVEISTQFFRMVALI
jgi:hypothetical protein